MKIRKAICIAMALAFAFSAIQIMAFASDATNDADYAAHLPGDVTVIVDEDASPETKAKIYAHFSGEEPEPGEKGLMCTLFGHKLETGTSKTVTHKARTTAPRCLEKTYNYEICSRCDYSQYTLISSKYIHCCS